MHEVDRHLWRLTSQELRMSMQDDWRMNLDRRELQVYCVINVEAHTAGQTSVACTAPEYFIVHIAKGQMTATIFRGKL